MRKIFFDTEFTGLHQNTTLVSIGLVSDEGERFYAELTDYDETQCDDWITKNVLDHLLLSGNTELEKELEEDELTTRVIGNRDDVRTELLNWLDGFGDDIQFVSDVCHYDMVLLCELIADGAMLLPEYINPFCHDLCQDISMILDISEKAAFDISREQLLTDRGIDLPKGQKHNALYDAEVIKAIHEDFFSVGGVKRFRFPLEYGNQRPLSSTWTVTGSGGFVVSDEKGSVKIKGITTGKIVDYGMEDPMNKIGRAHV